MRLSSRRSPSRALTSIRPQEWAPRRHPYDVSMRMDSVDEVHQALAAESYLPVRGLATAIYPSLAMGPSPAPRGEAGALAAVQRGDLDTETFWRRVLNAAGLVDWPSAQSRSS